MMRFTLNPANINVFIVIGILVLYTIYFGYIIRHYVKLNKKLEFENFKLRTQLDWYKHLCLQNNIELLDESKMSFQIEKDGYSAKNKN